jgi:hypothetical protein
MINMETQPFRMVQTVLEDSEDTLSNSKGLADLEGSEVPQEMVDLTFLNNYLDRAVVPHFRNNLQLL